MTAYKMSAFANNKKPLISNILCEENEVEEEDEEEEEEIIERFVRTKRNILLTKDEVRQLSRSSSAPPNFTVFPAIFFPQVDSPPKSPVLSLDAPVFVPSVSPVASVPSEFAEHRGKIALMALDQMGSRFLQDKLETVGLFDRSLIFDEISSAEIDLSTDIFGNYVVQKLFQMGEPPHLKAMTQRLLGRIFPLSCHMYGCRVIQAALANVDYADKLSILYELTDYVDRCIEDPNANHVIQKCIMYIRYSDITSIIRSCERKAFALATNQFGCMIIQRLLEHCPREAISSIIKMLVDRCVEASVDPFGNYVIQYLIEHGTASDRQIILNKFSGKICRLSRHKFSSNVIEKYLNFASYEQVRVVATELFTSSDVFALLIDKFANFVMQKVIGVSDENTKMSLIKKVQEYAGNLKMYTHGRHVLTFTEKIKKS